MSSEDGRVEQRRSRARLRALSRYGGKAEQHDDEARGRQFINHLEPYRFIGSITREVSAPWLHAAHPADQIRHIIQDGGRRLVVIVDSVDSHSGLQKREAALPEPTLRRGRLRRT